MNMDIDVLNEINKFCASHRGCTYCPFWSRFECRLKSVKYGRPYEWPEDNEETEENA